MPREPLPSRTSANGALDASSCAARPRRTPPRDLVAQFDLVDFGYTFRGADPDELAADPTRIRQALSTRAVYTRNLKSVVLPDLPRRQFNEVSVDLAPRQGTLYAEALGRSRR